MEGLRSEDLRRARRSSPLNGRFESHRPAGPTLSALYHKLSGQSEALNLTHDLVRETGEKRAKT